MIYGIILVGFSLVALAFCTWFIGKSLAKNK
ncbi:Uncharacterised protein [Helicobacter fennelliae]|uniref:Uncharacterized protein n=1 Tax=Helicobacter fennelliae TaxID=215 RepID=A0A2X3BFT3_9HELI|nr:Uncharacterised protein [Helicobacter fennelliae]STP07554.1 Uncharacterised protein [Helicobacter fennelliae]STQ85031.1 Uncharacterised protein [Helicobacter fennelliae]